MKGSCRWDMSTQEQGRVFPLASSLFEWKKQSHILWDHPWDLGWGMFLLALSTHPCLALGGCSGTHPAQGQQ